MLPPANRLRRSSDFTSAVRAGRRARSGRLVVHQVVTDDVDVAPRVGLIVGKSVGGSVQRHRVSRQLRAQLALRVAELPQRSITVVRALPPAAGARSRDLGLDLDHALTAVARRR